MSTNYKQEAIDYCLNNFDFDRVFDVMNHVEWKWYVGGEYKIPNKLELMQAAKARLTTAWLEKTTVESGGIRAVYVEPSFDNSTGKLEPPALELMFILTQVQNY